MLGTLGGRDSIRFLSTDATPVGSTSDALVVGHSERSQAEWLALDVNCAAADLDQQVVYHLHICA